MPIRVRRNGHRNFYLRKDGTWVHWSKASRFANEDSAERCCARHGILDYGTFDSPCTFGPDVDRAEEINVREDRLREAISRISHNYVWGKINQVHRIENYIVVEYVEQPCGGREGGRILFHPYIWGLRPDKFGAENLDDLNCAAESLESALLLAFGQRYCGYGNAGSSMAAAAQKILGVK